MLTGAYWLNSRVEPHFIAHTTDHTTSRLAVRFAGLGENERPIYFGERR